MSSFNESQVVKPIRSTPPSPQFNTENQEGFLIPGLTALDPTLGQTEPPTAEKKRLIYHNPILRPYPRSYEAKKGFDPDFPEKVEENGEMTITLDALILFLLKKREERDGGDPVCMVKDGKPVSISRVDYTGGVLCIE